MAETFYNIEAGFFDSIEGDRPYTAKQIIRAYHLLITDGIFSAHDDFRVIKTGDSALEVSPGRGQMLERWISVEAPQQITVPENTTGDIRKDSVILQVSLERSARASRIIYRAGDASDFPDLVNTSTLKELRLANLTVSPSDLISTLSDTRGSQDCPIASTPFRRHYTAGDGIQISDGTISLTGE